MQGILDDGAALFFAEDDADGRVLILLPHLSIQRRQIELHLADELGLEVAHFELDGHQTAQASVEQQ